MGAFSSALGTVLLMTQLASANMHATLPTPPEWHGASERLIVSAGNPWITPTEANGFTETPSYAETRAWLERLDAASPMIRMETFGRSPQGRDLLVVYATLNGELDPSKPTLLVQCGIHSGEIDGKEAGMMLLRDIAFGSQRHLVDRVNLVFVPIFNVDGHERSGPFNRPNQRGPNNQGWRNTAQNLNLNRDYVKADAPEMRAMLGLFQRVHPDLYLDVHVTDGMDYQYDITYTFQGRDGTYAASPHIARWLNAHYRPGVDAALTRNGHIPGDLVFAHNERDLSQGLLGYPFTPRYSQAYGDMVHMASILIENHSLKPFRQRVLGTYVLIEESLRQLAEHGRELRTATQADQRERPATLPVGWRETPQSAGVRHFLPMQHEQFTSAASGASETHWTGRAAPAADVPKYGVEPTITLHRPRAYWVPATKTDVIDVLRAHGIQFETITAPRTVDVDMLRLLDGQVAAGPPAEGHTRVNAGTPVRIHQQESMPAGSIRVPTDQPLGDLAVIMLDPQSEDSLLAWGFFNEILQRVEYADGYVLAPLADRMLAADPALKRAFEARLASDPGFAADPDARLQWFYARSAYVDARYQLYPVGIEP